MLETEVGLQSCYTEIELLPLALQKDHVKQLCVNVKGLCSIVRRYNNEEAIENKDEIKTFIFGHLSRVCIW